MEREGKERKRDRETGKEGEKARGERKERRGRSED